MQVTLPGGLTTTYKYDALGRRIQRTTSSGGDERHVYDGPDVTADLNSSSVVITSHINGPGIDDHP
jgi:YD repeat-containing protein